MGPKLPSGPEHHHAYGFANPSGLTGTNPVSFIQDRARLAFFPVERTPVAALSPEDAQARWKASAPHDTVQWLGHSSVRIRLAGEVFLVDPVFAKILSPVPPFGPIRATPPPATRADLDDADTILITHDHYDHLQARLVRRLADRTMTCIVPLGVKKLAVRHCPTLELDWYQSHRKNGVRTTFLPAQHESGRGPFNRDRTLWGAFMLEGGGKRVYVSGDTGYGPHFVQARRRGPIDFAILNVGGYRPRAFNQHIHMSPEQAIMALRDLGARRALIVHWGTYGLGLETGQETYDRVRAAARAAKLPSDAVVFKQIGDITRM